MFDHINLDELGTAFMIIRKQQRMSQEDLAANCGLSRAIISLIELGKGNPTVETLNVIAKSLGVTLRVSVVKGW